MGLRRRVAHIIGRGRDADAARWAADVPLQDDETSFGTRARALVRLRMRGLDGAAESLPRCYSGIAPSLA